MTYLAIPEGYPPKSAWDRFFLGVRRIGPDVDFFRQNALLQAKRSAEQLSEWQEDQRELAASVGRIFAEQLGWKNHIFLPGDEVQAILCGPRPLLVPTYPKDALAAIEEFAGVKIGSVPTTFGALVSQLLSARAV